MSLEHLDIVAQLFDAVKQHPARDASIDSSGLISAEINASGFVQKLEDSIEIIFRLFERLFVP
jgi:hypothetical protein